MPDVSTPPAAVTPTAVWSEPSAPGRPSAPLLALVAANAVSLGGNVVMTVAIPWLVLATTGSAAIAGLAVLAGAAGAVAGGLLAGRVVDKLGPARASSAADLLNGLAVAPLAILVSLNVLSVWQILLLVALGTLVDSAGSTARQGMVSAVADSGDYQRERANAMFSAAEHVGYLVGAPIAGLLIAVVGVAGALWVTSVAFVLAALLVRWLVQVPALPATRSPGSASLREVLGLIWSDPALRALVVFPTMAVLIVGPIVPIVLPVLARQAFDDPMVLGSMVASYGTGGLLGTATFGIVGSRVSRRMIYRGVFVVWPSAFAAIALVPVLSVTLTMLVIIGIATGTLVPLQATIRQERSPARLLPRVVGLSTATIPVAAPLGGIVAGVLIDTLDLHQALILMSTFAGFVGMVVVTSQVTHTFEPVEAPCLAARAG